ncbi:MAG TPA: hypothetical protein VH325_17015, partial [Bryobacteraceae bacterium]|nr:hypothetical protein [Bryobacteraceae bacterium]
KSLSVSIAMRAIPRCEPESIQSQLDWAEDRAMLGSNPSADSVAGIAGSLLLPVPLTILAPSDKSMG